MQNGFIVFTDFSNNELKRNPSDCISIQREFSIVLATLPIEAEIWLHIFVSTWHLLKKMLDAL
jgi:hypothetical protein